MPEAMFGLGNGVEGRAVRFFLRYQELKCRRRCSVSDLVIAPKPFPIRFQAGF